MHLRPLSHRDGMNSGADEEVYLKKIEQLQNLSRTSIEIKSISTIKIDPLFQSIFPIKEDVLQGIKESLRDHGFDYAHPIILWEKKGVVLDGHTRLEAAKQIGLEEVPVLFLEFNNEVDAKNYVYGLQFNRRNVSQGDRIRFLMQYLDQLEKKPLELRKHIAKILCISERTSYKYLHVIAAKGSQIFEDVMQEKITLNKADFLLSQKNMPHLDQNIPGQESRSLPLIQFFQGMQELSQRERTKIAPILRNYTSSLLACRAIPKQISSEIFTKLALLEHPHPMEKTPS